MRDVEELPKVFCLMCGEEIGEGCYLNDIEENIVGCDKCCDWDMEQSGCPLVENKSGKAIGTYKHISTVSYWELMERGVEKEDNMMLFFRENQWDCERWG